MSNADAQAQEPSMEEILASIRRIISEDSEGAPDGEAAADAPADAAEKTPADGDNVLELTEMVGDDGEVVSLKDKAAAQAVSEEAPSEQNAAEPDVSEEEAETPAGAEPSEEVAFAADEEAQPAAEDRLMSDDKASAAAAAMTTLLGAVGPDTAAHKGGGLTVEAIARELMRPVLKQWLDENLPELVERIVRSEIERVVGRPSGR